MLKKAKIAVVGCAIAGLAPTLSANAETVLRFGTTAPPGTHISKFFDAWAAEVNAVPDGDVKIKVMHGSALGNMLTIYDNVKNNVANIGWISTGLVPGKFKKLNLTRLPYLLKKAEPASVALWKTYKAGHFKDELDEMIPLAIHAFPVYSIHTNYPVKTLADLKGKKIAVSSRIAGQLTNAFGATPISIPLPKTYQSIQRNLVGGVLTVWTAFYPFKLQEVVKHHFEVNCGGATSILAINKEVWAKLSPKAKATLMSKSGLTYSRKLGRFWDGVWVGTKRAIGKMPGQTIVELTPEQVAGARKLAQPVIDTWIKETKGGSDAVNAFRRFYTEAAK